MYLYEHIHNQYIYIEIYIYTYVHIYIHIDMDICLSVACGQKLISRVDGVSERRRAISCVQQRQGAPGAFKICMS